MTSKREFLKRSALAGAGSVLLAKFGFIRRAFAAISGGTLEPASITKYTMPLVIPPAMPRTSGGQVEYYEIAVRQFQQQILPAAMPADDRLELRLGQSPEHVQLPRLHHRGAGTSDRCG